MRNRRWVAVVGLACALLCAWVAIAFLREPAPESSRRSDATVQPAASRNAGDASAKSGDATEADAGAARDRDSGGALTPTVVAIEPRLDWPDVAALRRIEQRGRVLCGGVVYAPDGGPCPGASVWCGETLIATSDDRGAWRADVPRPFDLENDAGRRFAPGHLPSGTLAARKPGVGFAQTELDPFSHRVDLHLQRGFTFSGTVVDNDDLHPVGAAELRARVGGFDERAVSDDLGRFAFENLPGGGLDLSGRAKGYDSNGSFPFNFDRGRDVEITFRLTKAYRLRGQFVPWPAPGIPAAGAVVTVVPRSPHDKMNSDPKLIRDVGADGSFDVALPVCPDCRVELVVEESVLWQTEVDVNEEKHDVDLGRIELTEAPATLTGRVEVPDEQLRALVAVEASVSFEGARPALVRTKLAADGSFRLAPLVAGYVSITVSFEECFLAGTGEAGGFTSAERDFGAGVLLEAGKTRDVGVITPTQNVILFGTVRDARGEPVARARIGAVMRFPDETLHPPFATYEVATSDEEGRWRCGHPAGRVAVSERFTVRARGFAPQLFTVERGAQESWVRRDIVLPDGVVLRGTLVDEGGAPLAGWSLQVEPGDADGDRRDERAANDTTRADGSFEVRGLEAGDYAVYVKARGGPRFKFAQVSPEKGEVTLRKGEALPAASAATSK